MPTKKKPFAPKAKRLSLSWEDYRRHPALNASTLGYYLTSARLAKWNLLNGRDESKSMLIGSAVHCLTLEPSKFPFRYAVWDGQRRGAEWKAFEAEHQSMIILTRAEYELVCNCRDSLKSNPDTNPIISARGKSEVTIVWTHARTGLQLKCRIDKLTKPHGVELKTVSDLVKFPNQFASLNYHFRAAMYLDGMHAAGASVPLYMPVVETSPPFDSAVFLPDDESLEVGHGLFETAIDRYLAARETGEYPGQHQGIQTLSLPAWARPESGEGSRADYSDL